MMADVPFSFTQAQSFFASLVGTSKLSTRAFNVVNESLMPLFLKGRGCYGQTAADAYNAVTEYYTHNTSIEANAPDGTADQRKREARRLLLSDTLAETMERGRKALVDYSAAR